MHITPTPQNSVQSIYEKWDLPNNVQSYSIYHRCMYVFVRMCLRFPVFKSRIQCFIFLKCGGPIEIFNQK